MIELTQQRYDERYDKYIIIIKDNYDIDHFDDSYQKDDLVAYFIGDRSSTNKKLRKRYSGPWKIIERLRHNTVLLENVDDPKQRLATHTSMLKPFYKEHFKPWIETLKSNRSKLLQDIRKRGKKKSKSTKSSSN